MLGGDPPKVLIVGTGLSGAVLARHLAEAGCRCDMFEEHDFIGGHCYTTRDPETGIMLHRHGPHTLHSDDENIWSFVERFATIWPYKHLKRAHTGGEFFVSPINLQTINQFFRTALGPDEAKALIAREAAPYAEKLEGPPANFEEAGLSMIGKRLYDAFYRGYTIKQWGLEPRNLPASVFGRVPVRFDYNDNYFKHSRQGQPVGGYSQLIERIVEHENIRVHLGRPFSPRTETDGYAHVFFSGPLDSFFDWRHGRLPYRTLRFEDERFMGSRQGCAVINFCDETTSFTRATEHKFFSPWEKPEATLVSYEYSSDCGPDDAPYYPLRLTKDRGLLDAYVATARATNGVSFIGRLGTYRYIDMDVAMTEAMNAAATTLDCLASDRPIPTFFIEP